MRAIIIMDQFVVVVNGVKWSLRSEGKTMDENLLTPRFVQAEKRTEMLLRARICSVEKRFWSREQKRGQPKGTN